MDKNVARERWSHFQKVALSGARCSLTDILIKEVSLGAIWRWIQSSHSYEHQYCLCMTCHSQWKPKAKYILHSLDVCLPITTEGFHPRSKLYSNTATWCGFLFFCWVFFNIFFIYLFIFVHVESSRLSWDGKEARAAAHDNTIQE